MSNVWYLAVSMILIWGLFVAYLGFLHNKVVRLSDRLEEHGENK